MKKIMAILAASAVALTLMGCDLLAAKAGSGESEGTKTNQTITVDATAEAEKKLEKDYRRFVKQLGGSEKVAEITTTITFNDKDSILTIKDSKGNVTASTKIGYVFGMNKSWDATKDEAVKDTADSKLRDFYVFGFDPNGKRAYVEHYSNINFKEELDTDESAIGTCDEAIYGGGSWAAVKEGTDYTVEDGVYTLVVSVKQSKKGTYEFFLGDKSLGSTKLTSKFVDDDGYAIGGVGGYVNVPKGGKAVVNYATDKKSVTGTFFADEE